MKFTITDPIAIRRIIGRFTCPVCKRTYHESGARRRTTVVCDDDGAPLEKRTDEDALTVKRRLAIYRQQTEPLEGFYARARSARRGRRRGAGRRGVASGSSEALAEASG